MTHWATNPLVISILLLNLFRLWLFCDDLSRLIHRKNVTHLSRHPIMFVRHFEWNLIPIQVTSSQTSFLKRYNGTSLKLIQLSRLFSDYNQRRRKVLAKNSHKIFQILTKLFRCNRNRVKFLWHFACFYFIICRCKCYTALNHGKSKIKREWDGKKNKPRGVLQVIFLCLSPWWVFFSRDLVLSINSTR